MMRTYVFTDSQLVEAFQRAKVGDKFLVTPKNGDASAKGEQNRVYKVASCAGRQIVMRRIRNNQRAWKATVLE